MKRNQRENYGSLSYLGISSLSNQLIQRDSRNKGKIRRKERKNTGGKEGKDSCP